MITVTSSTGRKVTLSLDDTHTSIIANVGTIGVHKNVTFGVTQKATGFASDLLIEEAGRKRLEVILTGDDLDASRALFAELESIIKDRYEDLAAYEARRARILSAE